MVQCPNCGGILKFDISSQQMKCDSCSSLFDPYAFQLSGAEESTEYDVTVFRCTQCGGEIYSTDERAASFCSYCGTPNVLQSRLAKEKKPELIIPFKQTKVQCQLAFEKFIKRAIFAPNSYRQAGKANSFRGIYMPYWLYDMSQSGDLSIPTSTSHRSGDYIITDHYRCKGRLDNYYNGVSYDASSSFADDISSSIAPFNVKDITTFNPSFLSGYYADIADVSSQTYQDTAVNLAQESTYNYLTRQSPMKVNHFEEPKSATLASIKTNINVRRSAMFPVWFMSYRNKDRVAYATVNGQSGKVSADIPMSVPKYLACALGFAVILFIILQLFFTITPDVLIIIAAVLGLIGACLYGSEIKKIVAKENYDNDLGMLSKIEEKKRARQNAQRGASFSGQDQYELTENDIRRMNSENERRRKAQKKGGVSAASIIFLVMLIFFLGPFILGIIGTIFTVADASTMPIIGLAAGVIMFIITVIISVKAKKNINMMKSNKKFPATIFTAVSMLIIAGISIWDPPSDFIYYGAAILAMVGIIINIIDLMLCHNLLAMRPLPQFDIYK